MEKRARVERKINLGISIYHCTINIHARSPFREPKQLVNKKRECDIAAEAYNFDRIHSKPRRVADTVARATAQKNIYSSYISSRI